MTRPGPCRPSSLALDHTAALVSALVGAFRFAATAALCCAPGFTGLAAAQTADCAALRAAIDAAPQAVDPAEADAALRRQRDEILRTRDYANRTGCGDGFFDDPDSIPCRSLARRIGMLQVGLQRMQDQAARAADDAHGTDGADGGDRRRDLQARFDARCTAVPTIDRGEAGDAPTILVPTDPDAPPGPAAKPRASRVLCVRHCDGAYYPLATDVAADRMADMDRICQAQCPSAESSAYAGGSGDGDVASATATDGTAYSALPAAFGFLKGSVKACGCRAPRQSWAEALAGAEALLQPHKGDVTVTAELAAAMARPSDAPQRLVPAAAKPAPSAQPTMPAAPRRKAKPKAAPPLAAPAPPPALDLTREFRGSEPTL